MKRFNLSAICAAALLLAIPFAGCSQGDSGSIQPHQDVELTQEIEGNEENTDNKCPDDNCDDGECPDGKRPEKRDGNDGKRPDGRCPDGRCPKTGGRKPRGKDRDAKPLPCPIDGDNGNN